VGGAVVKRARFEIVNTPPSSQACLTAYQGMCVVLRFPKGATVEQLMDSFGMSRACAFRYRAAMEAALGIDLHLPKGRSDCRPSKAKVAEPQP
jgi:hypothetical protein